MSAPSIRSVGTVQASGGNLSPVWPTHQKDDIGLLWVQTANEVISFSNNQGFAGIVQLGTGTAAATGSTRLGLFWVRCTSGSMASPTIPAGDHAMGAIIVIKDCVTIGNPFDVFASDTATSATTSVVIPSATPTVANTLVLVAVANGSDFTTPQVPGTFVNAGLAGLTEIFDFNRMPDQFGGGIAIAAGTRSAASAYGTTTATLANASKQARISIAFKSASTVTAPSPTFQAAGVPSSNVGTNTVAWPTHLTDDIALLVVTSPNEAISLSTAAGFVEIPDSPQFTGAANASDAVRLAVYWCRATSSAMASPVVADVGNHTNAQIFTFRGCITTGNPYDVTSGNVQATTTSAVVVPGDTTTVDNCLVVAISSDSRDIDSNAWYSSWANADLTSVTERGDYHTETGTGTGFGLATGIKATAGAYGNTTAQMVSSAGGVQARISIALKPPSAAGPAPVGDPNIPHRYWKLELANTPGSGPFINQLEVDERNDNAGVAAGTIHNPSKMHPGVTHIRPYFNANNTGDGVFDIDVSIMTLPAGYSIDMPTDQVTRTVDTFSTADGILKPNVGQDDGAGSLPLVKGFVEGIGRHGDAVVFGDYGRVFQNIPNIDITGGISTQPASKWGTAAAVEAGTAASAVDTTKPQYPNFGARDLTESGFEIQARLRQKGIETGRIVGFAQTHLDSGGITDTVSTLTNAPSNTDEYGVDMFGFCKLRSKNGQPFRVYLDYIIETTIDSGATWQARASGSFIIESISLVDEFYENYRFHRFTVQGLTSDGTDRVRVRMPRNIRTEGLGTYNLTETRIQAINFFFNTGTDSFANKTPDGTDNVHWKATGWV